MVASLRHSRGKGRQDEGSSWRQSSRSPDRRRGTTCRSRLDRALHNGASEIHTEGSVEVRASCHLCGPDAESFRTIREKNVDIPRLATISSRARHWMSLNPSALLLQSAKVTPTDAEIYSRHAPFCISYFCDSTLRIQQASNPGFPDLGTASISCASLPCSPAKHAACRRRLTLAGVIVLLGKDRLCINSSLVCSSLSINISRRTVPWWPVTSRVARSGDACAH